MISVIIKHQPFDLDDQICRHNSCRDFIGQPRPILWGGGPAPLPLNFWNPSINAQMTQSDQVRHGKTNGRGTCLQ